MGKKEKCFICEKLLKKKEDSGIVVYQGAPSNKFKERKVHGKCHFKIWRLIDYLQ